MARFRFLERFPNLIPEKIEILKEQSCKGIKQFAENFKKQSEMLQRILTGDSSQKSKRSILIKEKREISKELKEYLLQIGQNLENNYAEVYSEYEDCVGQLKLCFGAEKFYSKLVGKTIAEQS